MDLLEEGYDEQALDVLKGGLETIVALRDLFLERGIKAPRLFGILRRLEAEIREHCRLAREPEDGGEEE